MLIRCTRKLIKELGVSGPPTLSVVPARPLLEWYGNLVRFDRRKCLIFVDSTTLFTFLIPAVSKAQYPRFDDLFRRYLTEALESEGVEVKRHAEPSAIRFGPTQDRRVLGSLNELVFMWTTQLAYEGGLAGADLREIGRKVNRTPMSLTDDYPVELIRRTISVAAI